MERPIEIKRAAICIGISLILGFVKIALNAQHLASQGILIATAFIFPSIITAILLFFVYKTYHNIFRWTVAIVKDCGNNRDGLSCGRLRRIKAYLGRIQLQIGQC